MVVRWLTSLQLWRLLVSVLYPCYALPVGGPDHQILCSSCPFWSPLPHLWYLSSSHWIPWYFVAQGQSTVSGWVLIHVWMQVVTWLNVYPFLHVDSWSWSLIGWLWVVLGFFVLLVLLLVVGSARRQPCSCLSFSCCEVAISFLATLDICVLFDFFLCWFFGWWNPWFFEIPLTALTICQSVTVSDLRAREFAHWLTGVFSQSQSGFWSARSINCMVLQGRVVFWACLLRIDGQFVRKKNLFVAGKYKTITKWLNWSNAKNSIEIGLKSPEIYDFDFFPFAFQKSHTFDISFLNFFLF